MASSTTKRPPRRAAPLPASISVSRPHCASCFRVDQADGLRLALVAPVELRRLVHALPASRRRRRRRSRPRSGTRSAGRRASGPRSRCRGCRRSPAKRTLTSRFLPLPTSSVVKRNAPSSTCSVALNRSLPGCISANTRRPFSPSFTTLPSASFTCTRARCRRDAVARAQLHARRERHALAVALEPRRHLHAVHHRPGCCARRRQRHDREEKASSSVFIEASRFAGCLRDRPPVGMR